MYICNVFSIDNLSIGESAKVLEVGGEKSLRMHFLDMGLIPGAEIKLIKRAPIGDPVEILVQGYSLTMRKSEASQIRVEPVEATDRKEDASETDFGYNLSLHEHNAHPGYGEEGIYHDPSAQALPKDTVLTFALVGQQNAGKTTLFNALTGSNQHVGNFPGVTVDRKDGEIKGHPGTVLTDLPGIYSLSTYTQEELVARRFLVNDRPKAIINVVDSGNIERHLYLTMQLMELGIPVVLALNMMDELRAGGGSVRLNEMERALGIPVVPVSASRGEGLEELIEHAIHTARYQEAPQRQDFCPSEGPEAAVHRCVHSIMSLIEDHAERSGLPLRFAASRLIEDDAEVAGILGLDRGERETIGHIVRQMEDERGLDRHAAMASMRYAFIGKLCRHTVRRPAESREFTRSLRLDRVLTGKWTAVPAFLAIIGLVFYLTFDLIGPWLQTRLANAIAGLGAIVDVAFERWNVSVPVRSLVEDAVFGGVGSVVSFVPIIIVLFFFLSLLEDSGYMARVAFVSDGLFRKLGLSGRSIVPMLIGFGCTVPGVMAARTLPSSRDRRLTILLLPFMSCSGKVAVYGLLSAAFFPSHAGLVMMLVYLLGIVLGIVAALVMKLISRGREAAPFVMELPVYRLPIARNVGHLLWDKTKDFLEKAFTVIFIATIAIWFLQSFDLRLNYTDSSDSILAAIAGLVAPLMEPIGLGDWRIVTALISGFMAKESIVAMMEMLGATAVLTTASAASLLVFSLLYTPCIAAIAAIRRELGSLWAASVLVGQCVIAWVVAFGVSVLFI